MKDYYKLLDIDQNADPKAIREAVGKALRLWTTRQAAPDVNARQEAERMVANLEEAEDLLLDANRRSAYDEQLSAWRATEHERKAERAPVADGDDLVAQGWQCLIEGDIADALHYATKATEADGKNAEAWALLGQARYRWGDVEDALYEYRRAIKLAPNNASYHFDLASVYEAHGDLDKAHTNFERASKIEPKSIGYRAAFGQSLINLERVKPGIQILEQCHKAEPDNEPIQNLLARAYLCDIFAGWTMDEDGLMYATERAHVDSAMACIKRAESLNVSDSDTRRLIQENREFVASNLERRFHGSVVTGIAGGLIWMLVNVFLVVLGPLYFAVSRTPQFALNKRAFAGEKTFDEQMAGSGLIGLVIGALCLPLMIVVNGIRNYTGSNSTRPV